ncbi:MAG: 2-hydroxychromene-2-carboxylate isomerase, partial [Comamonadaceae bacterium]
DLSTAEAIVSGDLPPGLDRAALRAGIDSDEARALLRTNIDESMRLGVFGSPTVLVDGELFWGIDAFATLEAWLARGGW